MWADLTSCSSITKKSLKKGRFFEHDTRSNTEFYSYVNSNKKNFDTKMYFEDSKQEKLTEEIINKSVVSVVFKNKNIKNNFDFNLKKYERKKHQKNQQKRLKKQKLNDARQMLISKRTKQSNCCCHCACSTDGGGVLNQKNITEGIFIKHHVQDIYKIPNSCGLVDSRFQIGLQQPISMKELRSVVRFVCFFFVVVCVLHKYLVFCFASSYSRFEDYILLLIWQTVWSLVFFICIGLF